MTLLKKEEINDALSSLNGWNQEEKEITKQFELKDFKDALSFVNKIGVKAEEMNPQGLQASIHQLFIALLLKVFYN